MTKLSWGVPGEKIYETGVDRGVVYIDNTGYTWNGLSSVQENSPGGEPEGLYVDGFKYGQYDVFNDYAAQIEAYSAPLQFGACGGTRELYSGLSVTNQPKKSFHMTYRTLISSDEDLNFGYKIHLIYNAIATPDTMTYASQNNNVDLETRRWTVTTNPPQVSGYRPTSHYVINTSRSQAGDIMALEDILYGTDSTSARFPTIAEVVALFA